MRALFPNLGRELSPIQFLALGYAVLCLLGAAILMLPACTAAGSGTPFVDALFTATSAVTTTGLVVVDTGTYFNGLGQAVILTMMQVGGLGYMVFIALAVIGFSGKLSLSNRMLLRESLSRPTTMDLLHFTKLVIAASLAIEVIGWGLLTFLLRAHVPWGEAIYSGLFHSVSTFCTAGFSLYADSMCGFHNQWSMNLVLIVLMILGALGFFVMYDLSAYAEKVMRGRYPRRLATHTKLVLCMLALVTVLGTVVVFLCEPWVAGVPLTQRGLHSVFQVFSAVTTAGLNSVDIGRMSAASIFLMALLMFIGAAPGSTAGGIKITTLGVIVAHLAAQLSGRTSTSLFRRRVDEATIMKALTVAIVAVLWSISATLALAMTERADFLSLLFEVCSALGTTGLSTGVTPSLTTAGKWIIVLTMLVGRVGPLGIALSIIRVRRTGAPLRATDEILVG